MSQLAGLVYKSRCLFLQSFVGSGLESKIVLKVLGNFDAGMAAYE